VRQKRLPVVFKEFQSFRRLVSGLANKRFLMELDSIGRKTISLKFKQFFTHPLSPEVVWETLPPKLMGGDPWVLGLDGKWLRRQGVVMVYRDITHKQNLFWSFWSSESYLCIQTDLERLLKLLGGNLPSGVVSDWKGSIVAGVATYFPNIPHQRCLAHVVRDAKRYLAKRSPFLSTRLLREIACQLPYITTKEEKTKWLAQLIRWQKRYGYRLTEKTIKTPNNTIKPNGSIRKQKRWWYTHNNLRSGWNLLTKDWDPFFTHLDHSLIPHSNNSLEGVNSQIKKRLSQHRGMKTLQQASFLFWYLIFTRTKTKQDIKKLWGVWKSRKKNNLATVYYP